MRDDCNIGERFFQVREVRAVAVLVAVAALFVLSACGSKTETKKPASQYTLTLSVTGGGSVTPSGSLSVTGGLPVAVSAIPEAGHYFARWLVLSGTAVATLSDSHATDATVTLAGDASIQAEFAWNASYSLTVLATGGGSVTPSGSLSVTGGLPVPVSATPDAGYHFVGWSVLSGTSVVTFSDPHAPATTVAITEDASIAAEFSNIWYVDMASSGGNYGTRWSDAFTDLQDALSLASSGEEIWVVSGTYVPTSDTDRNATFRLVPGVAVYGGFSGSETGVSERDWQANVTVLSGDIGVQGSASDNCYTVVMGATDATLDGFTVQGGNASDLSSAWDSSGRSGGGMYNSGVSGLTVANCVFSDNAAENSGGGMFNYNNSSLNVTNCVFSGNTAGYGGGMKNRLSSSPVVTNCVFSGNTGLRRRDVQSRGRLPGRDGLHVHGQHREQSRRRHVRLCQLIAGRDRLRILGKLGGRPRRRDFQPYFLFAGSHQLHLLKQHSGG